MKGVLRVAAVLWILGLVVAVVVALTPGAASSARDALGYELEPTSGSMRDALQISVHNGRWVIGLGVLGVLRRRSRHRRLLDAVIYANAATNVALVGVALGAYGARGLSYLVHVPVESLAVGAAIHGYRTGSRRPFATAVVLVALAALCESYLTPQ